MENENNFYPLSFSSLLSHFLLSLSLSLLLFLSTSRIHFQLDLIVTLKRRGELYNRAFSLSVSLFHPINESFTLKSSSFLCFFLPSSHFLEVPLSLFLSLSCLHFFFPSFSAIHTLPSFSCSSSSKSQTNSILSPFKTSPHTIFSFFPFLFPRSFSSPLLLPSFFLSLLLFPS